MRKESRAPWGTRPRKPPCQKLLMGERCPGRSPGSPEVTWESPWSLSDPVRAGSGVTGARAARSSVWTVVAAGDCSLEGSLDTLTRPASVTPPEATPPRDWSHHPLDSAGLPLHPGPRLSGVATCSWPWPSRPDSSWRRRPRRPRCPLSVCGPCLALSLRAWLSRALCSPLAPG